MEGQNFESREGEIDKMIEGFAQREEMNLDAIFSDIITFAELYEEYEYASAYLEQVAEEIGISFEEMIEYAQKLRERLTD